MRYASWTFNVDKLEDWLLTLEKLTELPRATDFSIKHRNDWLALCRLKWELEAAHGLWEKQQKEISEVPVVEDLEQYLADFATSTLKNEAINHGH